MRVEENDETLRAVGVTGDKMDARDDQERVAGGEKVGSVVRSEVAV